MPTDSQAPSAAAHELTKSTPSRGDALPPVREIQRATPPKREAILTACCLFCGVTAWGLHYQLGPTAGPTLAGCFLAYLFGGVGPTLSAVYALRERQLNVDLLMILAALGAAFIGDWLEGVVLLFLFSLSGTLEAFAMYRTTSSIESLISLRPREAMRVDPATQGEARVLVEDLHVGDVVRVRPGERFTVDGRVIEGESWADESTLTGESERIHKPTGATVFAGTINGQGSVLVKMTKAVADTTLERIVNLVHEAQAEKTPTQRFVESWQRPYVIGVLLAAVLVLFGARVFHTRSWYDAFYHAMVLLVASSPCAVVVSSPSVMLSAIARAGRHGVLFKGARHVESLGEVDVMAFDKTGTVTLGKPAMSGLWVSEGGDANRLLAYAATVERRSEHPLAASIVGELQRRGLDLLAGPIHDFHSHTGSGVHARIGGVWVGVGRENLFESHEHALPADLVQRAAEVREAGETALLVLTDDPQLYGVISVADQPRPEARPALTSLQRLGVKRIIVLTGDHQRVAAAVAARLGVDEFRAGLMPEQKVMELRRLADAHHLVAMVGDGVNDAPALATARVGIAMGAGGTDVALEVADVVLMRDDLRALPLAVWICRQARRRVRQNMTFAFGMIGLLVLASFANLPLWLGVLGHEGSTVLVVFNGLRLLWEKAAVPVGEPSTSVIS